jgi:large subunit ribosomal protein L31e
MSEDDEIFEEDIEKEELFTIPFRDVKHAPRHKRTVRAIRILKHYIQRHMKVDPLDVRIDPELNETIWKQGIEKPPRKIRVRAVKDVEGVVEVYLAK